MSTTQQSEAPSGTTAEQRFIDGLREMADFLEANPLIRPTTGDSAFVGFYGENARDRMLDAARQAGGRWEKVVYYEDDDTFKMERKFGPHSVVLYTARENVCERVVLGTKTVTREVPDPALVAEIPIVTVTEEIERVEWVCPPSLLSLDDATGQGRR